MSIGKLKQSEEWALKTDINMILLCLYHHDGDIMKMSGIWPESPKNKVTKETFESFARLNNQLRESGKIK